MPLSPKTVKFLKNMDHEAVRVSELGMARSKYLKKLEIPYQAQ